MGHDKNKEETGAFMRRMDLKDACSLLGVRITFALPHLSSFLLSPFFKGMFDPPKEWYFLGLLEGPESRNLCLISDQGVAIISNDKGTYGVVEEPFSGLTDLAFHMNYEEGVTFRMEWKNTSLKIWHDIKYVTPKIDQFFSLLARMEV